MIHGDLQFASADRELWSLTEAMCDGSISPDRIDKLESMLRESEEARLFFSAYMDVHGRLLWRFRGGEEITQDANENEPAEMPIAIDVGIEPLSPLPSLSTTHYPPSTTFVGGPVFSYMVASVVLCLMILGAWAYKISSVNRAPSNIVIRERAEKQHFAVVGQITGMKDCCWGKGETGTIIGASVPLDRKYALESGLMQITYKTGAKVILEGPCEYTVDSRDRGYLRVGKLVARVEKKVASGQWPVARKEGRGEREEGRDGLAASAASKKPLATSHWPLTTNPQSPAPGPQPPLSTLHSPLFTIATPTAIVTDLGTEFGVEVTTDLQTNVNTFQGLVEVRPVSQDSEEKRQPIRLQGGQSARVVPKANRNSEVVRGTVPPDDTIFIRSIPRRVPIEVFGTGVGADPKDMLDPHWEAVRFFTNDPAKKPVRGLVKVRNIATNYNFSRINARWVEAQFEEAPPPGCGLIYRTKFTLPDDADLESADMVIQVLHIEGQEPGVIKLNGCELASHKLEGNGTNSETLEPVRIREGYVAGENVLEIEFTQAGEQGRLPDRNYLLVELSGLVTRGGRIGKLPADNGHSPLSSEGKKAEAD